MRRVVWFSCGAASAITTQIVLRDNPDAVVARIWLAREHPDNDRFMADIESWLGFKTIVLRSPNYNADHVEVIRQTRYVNGPTGARRPTEIKPND